MKSTIFGRITIFYEVEAAGRGVDARAKMMENGEADVSRDDLKRAVKQAILLNEYLLRRAWGILYIVLAFSMFVSIFGVAILDVARSFGVLGSIVTAMTASGSGLIVVLWTFKRVTYAAEITHFEDVPAWSRLLGYRLLVPLWIVTNGAMILTAVLARAELSLAFFLIHLGLAVYLYYALTLSFSKGIPREAVIAIGSLSLTNVASIALLSVSVGAGIYGLLWGATIVAWVSSGAFARTRPVPEFVEERTGLE
jgi:uncharacterized membrane protein YGL010W